MTFADNEVFYVSPTGTNTDTYNCSSTNPCAHPQWVIFGHMMEGTGKTLVIKDGAYDITQGQDWDTFDPTDLDTYEDWDDFSSAPVCGGGSVCSSGHRAGQSCTNNSECRLVESATALACGDTTWRERGRCINDPAIECTNNNSLATCGQVNNCNTVETVMFLPPNSTCSNCAITVENPPTTPDTPEGIRDSAHGGVVDDSAFGTKLIADDGLTKCLVANSDGWTSNGLYCESSSGMTICNLDGHNLELTRFVRDAFDLGVEAVVTIDQATDVLVSRVDIHQENYECWVAGERTTATGLQSDPQVYFWSIDNSSGVTIEDSAFWGGDYLAGGIDNVEDLTFRRNRIEHWVSHGMTLTDVRGFLFENNIVGGSPWGHCWNGEDQASLTATICYGSSQASADGMCSNESGECESNICTGGVNAGQTCSSQSDCGAVCRLDDCLCRRGIGSNEPDPQCGTCLTGYETLGSCSTSGEPCGTSEDCPVGQTCDGSDSGDRDRCYRGARVFEINEVYPSASRDYGLLARNNTFVGHGYGYERILSGSAKYRLNAAAIQSNCTGGQLTGTGKGLCDGNMAKACDPAADNCNNDGDCIANQCSGGFNHGATCSGDPDCEEGTCRPRCHANLVYFWNNIVHDGYAGLGSKHTFHSLMVDDGWYEIDGWDLDANLYSIGPSHNGDKTMKFWDGGLPPDGDSWLSTTVFADPPGEDSDMGRCVWNGKFPPANTTDGAKLLDPDTECTADEPEETCAGGEVCCGSFAPYCDNSIGWETVEPSGWYYEDLSPHFLAYEAANYSATNSSAPFVDAGSDGATNGIGHCADDDHYGNDRDDGNCDVGALELPSCPSLSQCWLNGEICDGWTGCARGSESGSVDTGLKRCRQADSTIYPPSGECDPGEFIHVVTYPCEECSCCTENPACLCPLGGCSGNAQELDCR